MVTLKQLRAMLAVVETGHFGRAAERLGVTQPALSQQIASLEELSGARVLDRLPRGIVVTPFGDELLVRARAVLDAADALESFVAAAGALVRPLRFGLIPTVAPYLLPDIFPALKSALPDVSFSVSESRTEALLEGLVAGTLDLALIATEPTAMVHGRLVSVKLFDDAFVLATSRRDAVPTPVSLADLDVGRMLLLDEGHCFREQAIAACGLGRDAAARTFAATSLSTIVEFVANGQGMTLLPQISLRKEGADPRIRIHPLASPGAQRTLRLCWRRASPLATSLAAVAEVIRELGAKLAS